MFPVSGPFGLFSGDPELPYSSCSHTTIFHNCGRDKHDKDRAQIYKIRGPTVPQPSSRRKSFPIGHRCNKFGLTEIYWVGGQFVSDTIKESWFSPTGMPNNNEAQPFANPLFLRESISFSLRHTPDIERWRSARDLFTQCNIGRPCSWLSDIEDLSLSRDGNASPRRSWRYCHICSTPTSALAYCSSCGHRLCERCKCELSGDTPQAQANVSHPSPTISRDGSQYAPASSIDPEFIQRPSDGVGIASTIPETRNYDSVDTRLHRPSKPRTDTSWRRNEERGKEKIFSDISASFSSDHSHMSERLPEQIWGKSILLIQKSPFAVQDNYDKKQGSGHHVCSSPITQVECDDPMCRATHAGHFPFRHSVSCSRHGSEQIRLALDAGGVSKGPPEAVIRESDSNKSLTPDKAGTHHPHHSAGFHSYRHIAEHLASAIGRDVYDLFEGRNVEDIATGWSTASTKQSPCPQHLTEPKPVTQIDSFQWTPGTISPIQPLRSGDVKQQYTLVTEAATRASNLQSRTTVTNDTAHQEQNTALEKAPISHDRNNMINGLGLFQDGNEPRRSLLVTPPWLRNPTKEAANATAPLHHVSTRSNDHKHPNIAPGAWRRRSAVRSTSPVRKVDNEEGCRPPLTRTHGRPEPSRATPKTHMDLAPSKHKKSHIPASVSKRREIFESVQDHTDTVSSTRKTGHIGKTLPHQVRHQNATCTHQDGLSQTLIGRQETRDTHLLSNTRLSEEENSPLEPLGTYLRWGGTNESFLLPEPEIANPTPIAPPNHECDWKAKYVALAAEIRQLKAEMTTRASLKSSGFLTPRYEQREGNIDLLGVTIILHSRDRDDIVLSTNMKQYVGPGNYQTQERVEVEEQARSPKNVYSCSET